MRRKDAGSRCLGGEDKDAQKKAGVRCFWASFGMYRQFIWKSWAPKMGRGKMLVLRGKMFGPWTAKGVLRGCSS